MSEKHVKYGIFSVVILLCSILIALIFMHKLKLVDGIILTLVIISGPYPFYLQIKLKRIRAIEEKMSDFLRDLSESIRFGLPLHSAICKCAKGNYGKLTPEIKKIANQIDWGAPAEDALQMFAERVNTAMVKRAVTILIKASRAGGDIADVLLLTATNIKDLQLIEDSRKVEMTSYTAVVYVAFFVFLACVVIINTVFLSAIASQPTGIEVTEGAGAQLEAIGGGINIEELKLIYLLAAIIQGFGDGILIGVIEKGSIINGFRHSSIMIIIGYVGLRVI